MVKTDWVRKVIISNFLSHVFMFPTTTAVIIEFKMISFFDHEILEFISASLYS